MKKSAKEIDEIMKNRIKGEYVEEATRFTVDSILGDNLRILIAKLAQPIRKNIGIAGLTRLGIWKEEKEIVDTREKVAAMIDVEPARLLETAVFVRIQKQTFGITRQVREESKKAYKPLLSREIIPSKGKSEEFR